MTKPKAPRPISDAPAIRIPETILKELDRHADTIVRGTRLSRIQMVSIALRGWLDSTKPSITQKTFIPTGVDGFDRVIGGGLVKGSTILFSGYFGSGKTTLLLAVASGVSNNINKGTNSVLYIISDQSITDVTKHAQRLGLSLECTIMRGDDYEDAIDYAAKVKPTLIVVDALPKAFSQRKKYVQMITEFCKSTKTCSILVNHMVKGAPANEGTLTHYVDTLVTLAFPLEGDKDAPKGDDVRILVCDGKNRNGLDDVKSYWRLTDKGMILVS